MLKINSHLDSKIVALGGGMETKLIMQESYFEGVRGQGRGITSELTD